MKKSVLALAVLGAFAGVASAQSSVTLFGVVDLNIMSVDNNERTYSMGTDGMSSSRLGFRGVEDLGGGLKASFWLEAGLAPDTGGNLGSWGSNTANNANRLMFNRRSTVSLSNQWGELRLGRDYTPTFWSWTVFDPFGTNGVGSASNLALTGSLQALGFGQTGSYGTFSRADNMVAYFLPAGGFGPGLYGQVSVAAGEGAVANKYWGGRIGYAAGPFDIAASYGQTEVTGDADLNTWNIGGSWNFVFMKLSGFYSSMEVSGSVLGIADVDATRDNWYVGISAPFGQWNFKASYGGTNSSGRDILGNADASQWAIGTDYNLSKRTALYATWASIDNDANANFRVSNQSNLPAAGTTFNSSGIQLGVRHSF